MVPALSGLPVAALAYLREEVQSASHGRANAAYIAGDIAYIALTLKCQEGLSSNPTITSIVEGRATSIM